MSEQVRCPLCGWTRPVGEFGAYDLAVKDVQSLGGNRGFEHTEVEASEQLQQRIEDAIERVYYRYHPDAPPVDELVEERVDEAVAGVQSEGGPSLQEVVGKVEEAVEGAVAEERVRADVHGAVEEVVERDKGGVEAEIDEAIGRALRDSV